MSITQKDFKSNTLDVFFKFVNEVYKFGYVCEYFSAFIYKQNYKKMRSRKTPRFFLG